MKSLNGLIKVEADRSGVEKVKEIDWDSVDWRYSAGYLSRQLGVSDQTISKYRKKLGKPKSTIVNWNKDYMRNK
jgi:predicted transcriptional regulator